MAGAFLVKEGNRRWLLASLIGWDVEGLVAAWEASERTERQAA